MYPTSENIQEAGLIAIIRGDYSIKRMVQIGEALHDGGVTAVEITLNSTAALEGIAALRDAAPPDMLVGAGTVRTAAEVQAAIDAGAQFLISPNFDPDSVTISRQAGILHLPGVFTASEVQAAFAAGCKMVKLFPADMLGPAYIKALRAPLNDVLFVPTGGINADTIGAYVQAGAAAFGVGSALVQGPDQPLEMITERARELVKALQKARR